MSKLDELIANLCPNGVEYKTLGDIGTFYSGLNGKNKDDFKNGNAVFITYMNVFSNIEVKINVIDKVKVAENEIQNTVQYGDVLFTGSSETLEECGMSSVLTIHTKEKLYLNSFCFGYRFKDSEMFLPSFTKYLFRSNRLRQQIIKTANGVTRFNVSKERMKEVKIPVLPLEIQREIVRILDAFTELTAELTARKKQYEYYRDTLLSFTPPVQQRRIYEIAKVLRGKRLVRSQLNESGKYPVYHGGLEPLGFYSEYNREADSIMIINVGASAGIVGYCNKKFWSSDGCFCIQGTSEINDRFLYHYLKKYEQYFVSKVRFAGIPTLDKSVIEEFMLNIPSIDIQKHIVNILDNVEAICNDLNNGLPAEINARKTQYEYYRDKLLAFKTFKTFKTEEF